jgi:ribonucleoside-diphosphate reductase alpha chain
MRIKKKAGYLVNVDFNKIQERVKKQSKGLKVDYDEVSMKVMQGLYDGVTTNELDQLASQTAAMMTINHPDYSFLASRIAITALYKEVPDTFSEAIEKINKTTSLLSKELVELVRKNKTVINREINSSRDLIHDYFGFKTLERAYLLRDKKGVIETPQYMWMRMALGICKGDLGLAFEIYNLVSDGWYTHATPTIFNSGTRKPQLSSCFLLANKGDSLEGLFDTIKDVASISKWAGGIGLHIHDVRANGAYINGTGGQSDGLMPMLKTYNEVARWINQGGKRKGSFAMYLEPWHSDIEVFIDIRKNHGKEEMRARDLFTALWMPDLFMERLIDNQDWTLFSPDEAPGLSDVYGDEFKKLYEKYESEGKGRNTIKAQDLWEKICIAQIETGTPYIGYKDAVNKKSNQKNLGTIKSSNLCIEINEFSSKDEQAVCNLASIALPKYIINGEFYHNRLFDVIKIIVKGLNNVIDVNYYPTKETKVSNMKHRPVGIGVQGLADVFAMMKIAFDSDEAKQLNKDIFETIYYSALSESCNIARENGKYESFEGSPLSKGEFQFDLWGVKPSDRWDWEELRKDIKEYGVINSLLIALMPTASTSQILGNNECFEPFNSNIYTRRTLAGEFPIINKHLIKDLEELDMWDSQMKNRLIEGKGSIQHIGEIPKEIRERYKTVYEISQKTIIDMAADRSPFVCQSQSMNLFLDKPTIGKISSMPGYAWKKGLKTGQYYLRSKPAVDAIQFTVDKEAAIPKNNKEDEMNSNFECVGCGS